MARFFRGRQAPSDQHQNIPVKQSFIPGGLILRFSRKNTEHRQHVQLVSRKSKKLLTALHHLQQFANQTSWNPKEGTFKWPGRRKSLATSHTHMLRSAQPPTSQEREKAECSWSGLTCRFLWGIGPGPNMAQRMSFRLPFKPIQEARGSASTRHGESPGHPEQGPTSQAP